jgi:hypothetical protein
MSNNKQSSIEWLISQLQRSKDWYRIINEINFMSSAEIDIIQQAREMYKDEMEAEVIKQCVERSTSDASKYAEGYKEGYNRALEYITDTIKNKIEIKEDANNEFRKGTANTTGTTFLCTEFISDQLFYKGTLPHCMRCGKPQYQHPIISNTQ